MAAPRTKRAQEGDSHLAWAGESEVRSVAQLKMLHRLARRLNELNDVGQIAEAITGELRALIDYHNCRVHLISEDGKTLVPIAFRGELSAYQGETFDALVLRVGEGVTGRVAVSGESYYAPNTNVDPYAVLIAGTPELDESLLVVPLRYGARIIGTVALAKLGVDQFDGEDQRVLEVLASHAAVAIENARLLEQERQQASASQGLLKFSQALTRMHGVRQVLAQAVASIPAQIECAGVHVYVRNPATGGFTWMLGPLLETALEDPPEVPGQVAMEFFHSVDEPFILAQEVVANVPEQYRLFDFDGEVLVAPLRWEPENLGAIAILSPSEGARFGERDLALAQGMADITSLALGNASRFDELQQAAQRLRALDEMKNTFLDAVSHELRTPLAAVLGIALTLQRRDISLSVEDWQDLLGRLVTNARKLERLLSDLLDLDRLARGIVQPNRQPTDVAALVRRVVETTDLFGDHPVILDVQPLVVPIDAPKVERILENLLANTARHTVAGTRVWVRAESRDGGLLLAVEDEGLGVPQDLREAIFEPFRQGPRRTPHSPGVGIGLSLVARFAELHGGRAWVEDRGGGGASFRVFLPGADAAEIAPALSQAPGA
jgi:signal transduction histidine kinase